MEVHEIEDFGDDWKEGIEFRQTSESEENWDEDFDVGAPFDIGKVLQQLGYVRDEVHGGWMKSWAHSTLFITDAHGEEDGKRRVRFFIGARQHWQRPMADGEIMEMLRRIHTGKFTESEEEEADWKELTTEKDLADQPIIFDEEFLRTLVDKGWSGPVVSRNEGDTLVEYKKRYGDREIGVQFHRSGFILIFLSSVTNRGHIQSYSARTSSVSPESINRFAIEIAGMVQRSQFHRFKYVARDLEQKVKSLLPMLNEAEEDEDDSWKEATNVERPKRWDVITVRKGMRLYQNPKTKLSFKLEWDDRLDDTYWVYIYNRAGSFIDGGSFHASAEEDPSFRAEELALRLFAEDGNYARALRLILGEAMEDEEEEEDWKNTVHIEAPDQTWHKRGKKYGKEIEYGPYKLNWHDYPDGSRIVSLYYRGSGRGDLYWRKNRKAGKKSLVWTGRPSWHHGSIEKLPPGFERYWDKWVERAFKVLDANGEGVSGYMSIPKLPGPSGEVNSRFGYLPPFTEEEELEESESEDCKRLVWKMYPVQYEAQDDDDDWKDLVLIPLGYWLQSAGYNFDGYQWTKQFGGGHCVMTIRQQGESDEWSMTSQCLGKELETLVGDEYAIKRALVKVYDVPRESGILESEEDDDVNWKDLQPGINAAAIERWAFTDWELMHPGECNSADDFFVSVEGCELAVVVSRNGNVTNRWEDGTVGVPDHVRQEADREETLWKPSWLRNDVSWDSDADHWYDVYVNSSGHFMGFVEPDKVYRNPQIKESLDKKDRKRAAQQSYHVKIGGTYWFEYHCWESDSSCDAGLWYHSHQQCQVLEMQEAGFGKDMAERGYNGHSAGYNVRFTDGFEHVAMEDELYTDPKEFERPDPPSSPEQRRDKGKKILDYSRRTRIREADDEDIDWKEITGEPEFLPIHIGDIVRFISHKNLVAEVIEYHPENAPPYFVIRELEGTILSPITGTRLKHATPEEADLFRRQLKNRRRRLGLGESDEEDALGKDLMPDEAWKVRLRQGGWVSELDGRQVVRRKEDRWQRVFYSWEDSAWRLEHNGGGVLEGELDEVFELADKLWTQP